MQSYPVSCHFIPPQYPAVKYRFITFFDNRHEDIRYGTEW